MTSIPLHDLNNFDPRDRGTWEAMCQDYKDVGFIRVVDSSFDAGIITEGKRVGRELGELIRGYPELANKYALDPDTEIGAEEGKHKNKKWQFMLPAPGSGHAFPVVDEVPDYVEKKTAMIAAMNEINLKFLSALSLFMGKDEQHMARATRHGQTRVRDLWYPANEGRAVPHYDRGMLTTLSPDEKGLYMVDRTTDAIIPVVVDNPHEFILNGGFDMGYYTNYHLAPGQHGVTCGGQERNTTVMFRHFDKEFILNQRPDIFADPACPTEDMDYYSRHLFEVTASQGPLTKVMMDHLYDSFDAACKSTGTDVPHLGPNQRWDDIKPRFAFG